MTGTSSDAIQQRGFQFFNGPILSTQLSARPKVPLRFFSTLRFRFRLAQSQVAGTLRGQDQRDKQSEKLIRQRQEALQKIDAEFPVVAYESARPAEPEAKEKREAKRKDITRDDLALDQESIPVEIYHWPSGFSAIPVGQSNAVIIGHVSNAQAFCPVISLRSTLSSRCL